MSGRVDLYNSHYALTGQDAYRQIRLETYGEDLGQTSWITLQEARRFLSWLSLSPGSAILEVACGTGGLSLLAARELGARVTGIDINEHAVQAAEQAAFQAGAGRNAGGQGAGHPTQGDALTRRVTFQVQDASQPLPFKDGTFQAIFCNDSINHLPDRPAVLRDWYRLLGPSGKILYTDPIVVTGPLTNNEIGVRSSIGLFVFMPQGENERLLEASGFEILRVEDVTQSTAQVSQRWHAARRKQAQLLVQVEGQERFDGLQRFLEVVHSLAAERRLSRFAYLAVKRS